MYISCAKWVIMNIIGNRLHEREQERETEKGERDGSGDAGLLQLIYCNDRQCWGEPFGAALFSKGDDSYWGAYIKPCWYAPNILDYFFLSFFSITNLHRAPIKQYQCGTQIKIFDAAVLVFLLCVFLLSLSPFFFIHWKYLNGTTTCELHATL